MFVLKAECWKATWRNWRERRGACTHCGQLNEYPTLPTPLLPTPLSLMISFHISSWYQFIFVYFSYKILILHIFRIIMIIIRCFGMFRNVPCSWFYRRPLQSVQSGWRWRRVKLFARASNVVRTVSLNKHFWTKLKDVGGRGCCLILQEDRTRRTDRAVRGSCYHGMST